MLARRPTNRSPKAQILFEAAARAASEARRAERGCGQCRFCRESHRFGCSRTATASEVEAVMAIATGEESMALAEMADTTPVAEVTQ